jgi:hypothetical protein
MKSFLPDGERHGEESQKSEEDNKEEEGQEEVVLDQFISLFVDQRRRCEESNQLLSAMNGSTTTQPGPGRRSHRVVVRLFS